MDWLNVVFISYRYCCKTAKTKLANVNFQIFSRFCEVAVWIGNQTKPNRTEPNRPVVYSFDMPSDCTMLSIYLRLCELALFSCRTMRNRESDRLEEKD